MKPEHCVAHEEIDAQHEHIIELIEALGRAGSGVETDTSDVLLEHLSRYLRWHFKTEEELMAAVEYPDLEKHREEHRACAAKLDEFSLRLKQTGHLDVPVTATYLTEWLRQHTLGSDRNAADYIRQQDTHTK
jgi:hemerythrin